MYTHKIWNNSIKERLYRHCVAFTFFFEDWEHSLTAHHCICLPACAPHLCTFSSTAAQLWSKTPTDCKPPTYHHYTRHIFFWKLYICIHTLIHNHRFNACDNIEQEGSLKLHKQYESKNIDSKKDNITKVFKIYT